jgi:flagellar basal-body rod protein FlgG
MIRTLSTSASGLMAQQTNLERISNDLANANTDGYKRGKVEFQDLMYQTVKEPGAPLGNTSVTPVGIQNGTGVKVQSAHKVFEQGSAKTTYHPMDLMIEGQGFFQVTKPNGEPAYTRNGAFHSDAEGRMVLSDGSLLEPVITIPQNSSGVQVSQDGVVSAVVPGGGPPQQIGTIPIFRFRNEQGLMAEGNGLYRVSGASGPPLEGTAGQNGWGGISAGMLEGSNVNVPSAMVDMITTQRTYEMGTKVMGIADEMMGATVNIK